MKTKGYEDQLKFLAEDTREFVSRLRIIDKKGIDGKFNNPHPEQLAILDDLLSPAQTCVFYKPRQIGNTTVACAYNFAHAYWTRDAVKTLVVAHENDATNSIFGKIRHFYDSLPLMLRKGVKHSNRKELIFSDTNAGFRCMTAGGKSQGRAWTYQRIHADEMAFWPNAHEIWASIDATVHDGPHHKAIIMSTADGPGNLFHEKVMEAIAAQRNGDPTVRFRFFRWADHIEYRRAVPKGWEPDEEEYKLAQLHGLDIEQLYWRHTKIHGVKGTGISQFRRNYPLTIEDGFLISEGGWFDVDYLNQVLSSLKPSVGELRVFEKPQKSLRYVVGVDPSWANGGERGDYAVAQVLSEDGRQVATFSTKEGGDIRFAHKVAELCAYYGKARALVESNTGGAGPVVIRELQKYGIPLWQRPTPQRTATAKPKHWTTHRGSKEEGYSHLRQMVNGDALTLNDLTTVQELMHVREKDGSIEGQDGYHDDHADALMLAEWNRRTLSASTEHLPNDYRRSYSARAHPFSVQKPYR